MTDEIQGSDPFEVRPQRGAGAPRDPDRVGARRAPGERRAHPRAARTARVDPRRGDGMSVATDTKLIAPHGGELVDRTVGERPDDLGSLETLELTSRELSDLDMLASGAL